MAKKPTRKRPPARTAADRERHERRLYKVMRSYFAGQRGRIAEALKERYGENWTGNTTLEQRAGLEPIQLWRWDVPGHYERRVETHSEDDEGTEWGEDAAFVQDGPGQWVRAGQVHDYLPLVFWELERRLLYRLLIPTLLDAGGAGVAQGEAALAELSLGVDWTLANAELATWVREHADKLAEQLTENTRIALSKTIGAWMEDGTGFPDLIGRVGKVVGPKRAEIVAITETTRAFSAGNTALWKEEGYIEGRMWETANDEVVCFPAGTPVAANHGTLPIESIQVGGVVLTRQGWRKVLATSCRKYQGAMVEVTYDGGSFVCTGGHPIWTIERGWVRGGDIRPGDALQSSGDNACGVRTVRKFHICDPDDSPSIVGQEASLCGISGCVPVPVCPIYFHSDAKGGQQEVHAITPDLGFLDEFKIEAAERLSNAPLQQGFPPKASTAGHGTEPPIRIAREDTKACAASPALSILRRATTLLTAMVPMQSLLRYKHLAAPLAGNILRFSQPALSAANSVPISFRCEDREGLSTDGTYLLHPRDGCQLTRLGAIGLSPLGASGIQVKGLPALRAHLRLAAAGSLLWSVLHLLIAQWHSSPVRSKLRLLYHRRCVKSILVYNLMVEGAPEFFVGAGEQVLVHNCPICGYLDQQVADLDKRFLGEFGPIDNPPAHPRCRCGLSAVVKGL